MPVPLVHTLPTPPASPGKKHRWDESPPQPPPSPVRPTRTREGQEEVWPDIPPFPKPSQPPRRPSLVEEQQRRKKKKGQDEEEDGTDPRASSSRTPRGHVPVLPFANDSGKKSLMTQTWILRPLFHMKRPLTSSLTSHTGLSSRDQKRPVLTQALFVFRGSMSVLPISSL